MRITTEMRPIRKTLNAKLWHSTSLKYPILLRREHEPRLQGAGTKRSQAGHWDVPVSDSDKRDKTDYPQPRKPPGLLNYLGNFDSFILAVSDIDFPGCEGPQA